MKYIRKFNDETEFNNTYAKTDGGGGYIEPFVSLTKSTGKSNSNAVPAWIFYDGSGNIISKGPLTNGNKTLTSSACAPYADRIVKIVVNGKTKTIQNYAFKNVVNLEELIINYGCTTIGYEICDGLKKIKRVSIPDSVTSIDRDAFHNCESLTDVRISSQLSEFSKRLFGSCAFTKFKFPKHITAIRNRCFNVCLNLTEIILPKSVQTIEEGAFNSCLALKKVVLNEGLKTIGIHAFAFNQELTEVHIPSTLEQIDGAAFAITSHSIKFINNNNRFKFENYYITDEINKAVVSSYGMKNDTVVAEGIQKLNDYSFAYASRTYTIVLPSTLTTIGNNAFHGIALNRITCNAQQAPTLGSSVFDSTKTPSTGTLIVPTGSDYSSWISKTSGDGKLPSTWTIQYK